MDYKLSKYKRVKLNGKTLFEMRDALYARFSFDLNIRVAFEEELGMKFTSRRYVRLTRTHVYYFKIVDTKKYFLAKIKYGI